VRERSGSLSNGSGYGSPQHASSSGSYEMPGVLSSAPGAGAGAGDYGVPRRVNPGLHVNTGAGSWGRGDTEMCGMGMMKQNLNSPISVGGGGNGTGFAMMM